MLNSALSFYAMEIEKQGFNKLNSSMHYELNISYPKVICSKKLDIEHQINLDIQRIMIMAINNFRAKIIDVKSEKGAMGLSYLNLDYQVHHNNNGILSISFKKDTYFNGFDGIKIIKMTYNFDSQKNKVIRLKDLFDDEIDYKNAIFNKLKHKYSDIKLKKGVTSNFCVDTKGITFPLDSNKCKSKHCPEQVTLTWAEVKDITKPYVQELGL
ncbi:DUF4163 domain-containing protein [Flammeovirga sp. SubArs3]|uniref:PdaC/SigV domain-containing protein n=1 Tax=Flammeovirga sp. SubArs3 TaxID=2995316 RepID=UPI00248B497B|nr:DUF4163 domain-containing protein [Flammeovirga sp. SubArs3]